MKTTRTILAAMLLWLPIVTCDPQTFAAWYALVCAPDPACTVAP